MKGNAIFTAASAWGQTMFFVLIGLIIFALPAIQSVSLQTLTGYTLTLLYVIVPLEILINRLPDISRASIAVSKIEQLGITENDVTSLAQGVSPRRSTGRLSNWQEWSTLTTLRRRTAVSRLVQST